MASVVTFMEKRLGETLMLHESCSINKTRLRSQSYFSTNMCREDAACHAQGVARLLVINNPEMRKRTQTLKEGQDQPTVHQLHESELQMERAETAKHHVLKQKAGARHGRECLSEPQRHESAAFAPVMYSRFVLYQ